MLEGHEGMNLFPSEFLSKNILFCSFSPIYNRNAACLLYCMHWQITACACLSNWSGLITIIPMNTVINIVGKPSGKCTGLINREFSTKVMLINDLIM